MKTKTAYYLYDHKHFPTPESDWAARDFAARIIVDKEESPFYFIRNIQYWASPEFGLHRQDGPAIITSDNHLEYWEYGKPHNEHGPSIILANGQPLFWAFYGAIYKTQAEWEEAIRLDVIRNVNCS